MKISELWNRLLYLVSVPKCIYCSEILEYGDKGLCKSCLEQFEKELTRDCSRCAKLLNFCTCSNFFLEKQGIKKLVKIYRYSMKEEPTRGNMLIYSLKRSHRSDVIEFLGDRLCTVIRQSVDLSSNPIIASVPRRKESIRKYGYDHAKLLAERVAKQLGLDYTSILISESKKAQKELSKEERFHNAKVKVKNKKIKDIKGREVILIDDIVTTGASMAASGKALKRLGAKKVIGATISIAYKDSYIPFQKSFL